jgi:NADH dehydrogenase/NADH:ubiquinone oxidoreductase subunit G
MPTIANPTTPGVAEAEAAFAALHDRLMAGDPAVTAHAYAEARAAIDFASARQEAAHRAAAQQAEEERQQRFDDAKERLAALDDAAHDAARDQLRAALDNLALAVLDRSAELGQIVAEAGVSYGPAPGQVTLGGLTVRPLGFQSVIVALAEETTRRHFGPRHPFGLSVTNLPD